MPGPSFRSIMPAIMLPIMLLASGLVVSLPAMSGTAGATGEEELSFSYARLYDLKYQFVSLPGDSTSHLRFHLRLQPRHQDLPPLTAYVDWPRQRVELETDQQLNFLRLPLSPQLRQENPRVLTNWPKDSAALGLAMEISPPAGTPLDVAALLLGMEQANAAIRARSRRTAALTPQAVGVTLRAVADEPLVVTLIDADGEIHVMQSDRGKIDLQAADLKTKTEIRIEGELLVVFPWFD